MPTKSISEFPEPGPRGYKSRKAALLQLGFETYQDYLNSDLWAQIRSEAFDRQSNKNDPRAAGCYGCLIVVLKNEYQVHHRSYDLATMFGIDTQALVILCPDCHRLIEFDGDEKVSLAEANERLDRLRYEWAWTQFTDYRPIPVTNRGGRTQETWLRPQVKNGSPPRGGELRGEPQAVCADAV